MKVTAILKGRTDDQGRQTVYIRISEGQTRSFKALPIKVTKNDFKDGKVLLSHPNHKQYNIKIKEETLYVEKHGRFEKEENDSPLFIEYAAEQISIWEMQRKDGTIRQYNSELNKFRAFSEDYTLKQITTQVLRDYLAHCYKLGNTENTAWKTFKFVRKVIRQALKEELIIKNPLTLFEMPKYTDPQKQWLTEGEIKKLEGFLKKPVPEELKFAATWFLIGCYTGLRFGDMAAFNKKRHIVNNRLILYTGKTGEVVSIPVTDHVKELLTSIEYKPIYYTNTHYNRLLKQVAKIAEVDKEISAHISRHTAAIRWANAGISQEVVAKLLGHTNLKTTSIYYKIVGKRIDDELSKLG